MNQTVGRNDAEMDVIRAIAGTEEDAPLVMLNLNRYTPAANYPSGALYRRYMEALDALLPRVGAKILWRSTVHGQAVGAQPIDEILAVWYPSHAAFLGMPDQPGAQENYRLRAEAVDYAVIHRCDGSKAPLDGT